MQGADGPAMWPDNKAERCLARDREIFFRTTGIERGIGKLW